MRRHVVDVVKTTLFVGLLLAIMLVFARKGHSGEPAGNPVKITAIKSNGADTQARSCALNFSGGVTYDASTRMCTVAGSTTAGGSNAYGAVSMGAVTGDANSIESVNLTPAEVGAAKWTEWAYQSTNPGGARKDQVYCEGWNRAAGGDLLASGEPSFGMCVEDIYQPGASSTAQFETYFEYRGSDGTTSYRPLAMYTNRTTHATDLELISETGSACNRSAICWASWDASSTTLRSMAGSVRVQMGNTNAQLVDYAGSGRLVVEGSGANKNDVGGDTVCDQNNSGHGWKWGSTGQPFWGGYFGGTLANRPTCDSSTEMAHYTVPASGGTPTHEYQCCDTTGAGAFAWVAGTCG